MYRFVQTLACAVVLAAAPVLAQPATAPAAKGAAATAEPTKTVSGTIASVSASSVTVKAASGDMTFNVDAKTRVIAPGGGTKTRAAQAEGKAGAPITAVLSSGQAVEVKYHETGMHAASIRAIAAAPAGAKAAAAASGGEGAPAPAAAGSGAAAKSQTASGTVSAVSGASLTVKGTSGEWTFAVDEKTTVVGTGVGTAGKKLTAAGGKTTLTEFVHEGDNVSVTYHDISGTKHAGVVRITRKKV